MPKQFTGRIAKDRASQGDRQELETLVHERTRELTQENRQILKKYEELELTNRGLRKLSAHLFRVQDDERRRIARELHDSTGQSLALLSMNLSALQTETSTSNSNPILVERLSENIGIVKQVSAELRTLSYVLHPPLLDELGLESALRWYIDVFVEKSKIKVRLEWPEKIGRLARPYEIAIFRVVQECLTNVHRHSESPTADIKLSRTGSSVVLEVNDQGKGIPQGQLAEIANSPYSRGLGIKGMKQRIEDIEGAMEIVSRKNGTQVRVILPTAAA